MHPLLAKDEFLYQAKQDILCRRESVNCAHISGPIEAMYPIADQCRIELVGCACKDASGSALWEYVVTMPIMLVTDGGAQRASLHMPAHMETPFSEEKMRYGCQLQCNCDVYLRSAQITGAAQYAITYDARIALYALEMRPD